MKIRIWDLPTRLFHWLLVMAVIGSFMSVKLGGNAMIWHGRFGYFVLTLLFFRLIWGFVGTHHARFAQFIKSPQAILAYLKNPAETPGHSPIGAISVLVLLGLFLAQALAGLFASDDIAFDGPLAKYVASY
jgi:cytochrome b